jgi:hypothetical protein
MKLDVVFTADIHGRTNKEYVCSSIVNRNGEKNSTEFPDRKAWRGACKKIRRTVKVVKHAAIVGPHSELFLSVMKRGRSLIGGQRNPKKSTRIRVSPAIVLPPENPRSFRIELPRPTPK